MYCWPNIYISLVSLSYLKKNICMSKLPHYCYFSFALLSFKIVAWYNCTNNLNTDTCDRYPHLNFYAFYQICMGCVAFYSIDCSVIKTNFCTVVSTSHRVLTDGPLPSVMQKVPVPVITNRECEVMYRHAGYIEDIPNIFICAGYEGGKRDSCEVSQKDPACQRKQ